MAEPIIYQFIPNGHGDVVSAIRSISAAAQEQTRVFDTVATSSARGTRGQIRDAERAVAAANRSGKAQEDAAKRSALASEKAWEKGQEKKLREAQKVSDQIIKGYEKEAAAAERAAEKTARSVEKARAAFLKNPMRALGGLANAGLGMIAGLGRSAFSTGAHMVGGAVRESLETQAIANRVSINARMPGQAAVDPTTLRKEFERTAMATPGQSAADVGKATQAYVDLTGDLDTARSSMQTFATTASATGATMEDVATAAASIGKQFDVKSVADMQKVFAGLAFQGKGGAMTMKDIASQFQRLAAAGNAYGLGKGPQAVAKLGGLLQIARGSTGSARQAATAVENMFAALTGKAEKAGVKLYDKKGGKRDINEVIAELVSKEGGSDIGKKKAELNKFFSKQGVRGANQLIGAYEEAAAGKTGKEAQTAGYDAVLKKLQDMSSITAEWGEVQKDAAQAQRDSSAQLAAAWETLKAAVGDRLAPKLAELAGRLAGDGKVLDMFIAAVGLAADTLEALAAKLQELGFISGGSPEEKAAAAQKQSDIYQKQLNQLGGEGAYNSLSKEDQAKYREINAKKHRADAAVESANDAKRLADFQQSQEELQRKSGGLVKHGRGTPEMVENERLFKAGEGRWARKVEPPPVDAGTGLPNYATKPSATGQAAPFVMTGVAGGESTAAAQKALADFSASLLSAKANLDKIGAPGGSINGRPQVPGATH